MIVFYVCEIQLSLQAHQIQFMMSLTGFGAITKIPVKEQKQTEAINNGISLRIQARGM